MTRPTPLRPSGRETTRKTVVTFAFGSVAALACVWLGTPLPWMIGPLVITAALHLSGSRLTGVRPLPRGWSSFGQWIIGTTLGLYFTPQVAGQVVRLWPWLVLAIVAALILGAVGARLLMRFGRLDAPTAFFAAAIGGAAEMANQAERHGARVDRVAASHALRVAMVVLVVPFALRAADVHGLDPYVPSVAAIEPLRLVLLLAATAVCGYTLARSSITNAWTIGTLLCAAVLSIASVPLSAIPRPVLDAAQLAIGCSLGSRFAPDFLDAAPRFLATTVALVLGYLAVAAAFGIAIAYASGMEAGTAVLATSPGGIAEMSLTARNLALGVPIVTAFQAMRLIAVVMTIGPAYEAFMRRAAR